MIMKLALLALSCALLFQQSMDGRLSLSPEADTQVVQESVDGVEDAEDFALSDDEDFEEDEEDDAYDPALDEYYQEGWEEAARSGASGPRHYELLDQDFVLIKAGSFQMGSEEGGDDDEMPVHMVRLSRSFYLAKYELTQAEWVSLMDKNPSKFKGPERPVDHVSWDDAQEFLRRLNAAPPRSGVYRLPTEAEWEYAARAGSSTPYFFGADAADLSKYAWCGLSEQAASRPVGLLSPNSWGLYDMYGNVWEMVQDRYDPAYYAAGPELDPSGTEKGNYRVVRGGSWHSDQDNCRSAYRNYDGPDVRDDITGFRLVFEPTP